MIFSMLVVPHVVDKIFFEEGEEKKVVLVKNTVTYYLVKHFLILRHTFIFPRARENTILTKADFRALKRDKETTTTMYFCGF